MEKDKQCPLCKNRNGCQIEERTKACWCTMYQFTEEINRLLETLPLQCLCESCAQKLGAISKTK